MWGAIGLFVLILLVKVFAKYIFYVQRDPRARNARRQEELRRRQLNAKGEKRKATGYYVSGLYIYPVKSCKGIPLTSAEIGRYGFINDRRWMIVDKETNRFLTQRILPRMALISPSLLNNTRPATGKTATILQLEAPGMEAPLKVPIPHLNPKDSIRWETSSNVGDALEDEEIIEVTVWDDTVNAIDEGEEASQWLSRYLEREVRLVRLLHDNSRRVPEEYEVIEDDKVLNLTSFSDAFPFLLANEISLRDLNTRLTKQVYDPLPMARFRPNIIVDFHIEEGEENIPSLPPAYDEDDWKQVRIGGTNNGITFYPVKKCMRCKLTTVDPEKGEFGSTKKEGDKDEQPLAILKQYRTDDGGKTVFFAQNLIHSYHPSLQKQSVLVGDPLHVIERRGIDVDMTRATAAAAAAAAASTTISTLSASNKEKEETTLLPPSSTSTITSDISSTTTESEDSSHTKSE